MINRSLNGAARIILRHPLNLLVRSEIEDALNDISSIFFRIDVFWIHVPKQRWSKCDDLFCARFFEFMRSFHTFILAHFLSLFKVPIDNYFGFTSFYRVIFRDVDLERLSEELGLLLEAEAAFLGRQAVPSLN